MNTRVTLEDLLELVSDGQMLETSVFGGQKVVGTKEALVNVLRPEALHATVCEMDCKEGRMRIWTE